MNTNTNKYSKSQIISNCNFYGVQLDSKNYRESNTESLCNWVANGIQDDCVNVFKYELLDIYDLKTEVTPMLRAMSDDGVMWARSYINRRWLICIMTDKNKDYADGYLNAHSKDFNLLTEASFKQSYNDDELLLDIYSMTEHQSIKYFHREFATSECKDKEIKAVIQKQAVIRKS